MNYRFFIRIKLVLLIVALGLASFLAFGDKYHVYPDQKVVFVLDINRTMNTQDVFSGTQKISRLQAAKQLIKKTIISDPQFSYGLILFNASTEYILPPTFDTGTFLLYLSGITTNLLPDGPKNFAQLSGLLGETYTSYFVLSDFDDAEQHRPHFGKSVFSARNDTFAKSLHTSYSVLTDVNSFSSQNLLFGGFALPVSQRIVLYIVLGILVILIVLL